MIISMNCGDISGVGLIHFCNGAYIDASNSNNLEMQAGSGSGFIYIEDVRHKANVIYNVGKITYNNGSINQPSIAWSNGSDTSPSHHTGFYQPGDNHGKAIGITCSGERIATFWNQDPSAVSDISGGIQFYRDLSMNCNTIGDVSGIYWCDGTYIGPGSSFDISTNQHHFNITVGDVSNALQLDNSGNLKIGGIHSNAGYKFGWDNSNCRLGIGSQPPTLPGGTIYVTDLSGRDISSVAGVWINQQYGTVPKDSILGEIVFSASQIPFAEYRAAGIAACAAAEWGTTGTPWPEPAATAPTDLRFYTHNKGPYNEPDAYNETMRISEDGHVLILSTSQFGGTHDGFDPSRAVLHLRSFGEQSTTSGALMSDCNILVETSPSVPAPADPYQPKSELILRNNNGNSGGTLTGVSGEFASIRFQGVSGSSFQPDDFCKIQANREDATNTSLRFSTILDGVSGERYGNQFGWNRL